MELPLIPKKEKTKFNTDKTIMADLPLLLSRVTNENRLAQQCALPELQDKSNSIGC